MLGLGAVGGYRVWLVWTLLGLTALWLRREVGCWFRSVWGLLGQMWPANRGQRVWHGYLLAVFGLALLTAFLPPTAWDALVYHLTGPKLYLEAGRLVHPLDLPYLGFPQLGEMLFTMAMLLRRPAAAQLISLLFGALMALGCHGLAGQRWGRPAGALAAAILYSATTILLILSWPYVDVLLMYFTLAAFAALCRGLEQNSRRWLVAAGLFVGMAMSTKYTAVTIPAGAVLLILANWPVRRWHLVLLVIAVAAAFVAPWLLKNWVLTGNPVYPFLLPGRYWDSFRTWWFGRAGTGLAATAPWQILLAPWYATTRGVEGGVGFSATIGPLFLALTPLVLLHRRREPAKQRQWLSRLALFSAPSYLLWLIGISLSAQLVQTRLLFPIFPLLSLLGAAGVFGLDALNPPRLRLGWVVRATIAFVLLLNLIGLGLATLRQRPVSHIMGYYPSEEYLADRLGWHHAAMQALNDLPPDSQVLFLWEPRSFYCQVACWPDALLDRWWHARRTAGAPGDIAASWRSAGFTHLLLFQSGYQFTLEQGDDPISAADQVALQTLLAEELVVHQDFDGVYTLYRFR
jgi:hypothetical protein